MPRVWQPELKQSELPAPRLSIAVRTEFRIINPVILNPFLLLLDTSDNVG